MSPADAADMVSLIKFLCTGMPDAFWAHYGAPVLSFEVVGVV